VFNLFAETGDVGLGRECSLNNANDARHKPSRIIQIERPIIGVLPQPFINALEA
jgi:hypothetical protein